MEQRKPGENINKFASFIVLTILRRFSRNNSELKPSFLGVYKNGAFKSASKSSNLKTPHLGSQSQLSKTLRSAPIKKMFKVGSD